jgi:hypothetical protein
MKKKSAREIVREKMPGKRVVSPRRSAADAPPQADAVSLDLPALRRKYFGEAARPSADAATQAASGPSPDTEIVLVAPANPAADAGQSQAKGVVVTDGEITGEQG